MELRQNDRRDQLICRWGRGVHTSAGGSENKDSWISLSRPELPRTRVRVGMCAHHCPPVATDARILIKKGWEFWLLSYPTTGPVHELKLVEMDMFVTQSREENACLLIEKLPLNLLMKTSYLFIKKKKTTNTLFNIHSVLHTGLDARSPTTTKVITLWGQDYRWLFKAKRWSLWDSLHRKHH